MTRVNIPGEAPGSATYYMGSPPDAYGRRIFEMEHYGDARIRKALMDIGKERTEPHVTISSIGEYEDLIGKSLGRKVYSCLFGVSYQDIDVTVLADFQSKRLTLRVDPDIGPKQKKQLLQFFEILIADDYYQEVEDEEVEPHIPPLLKRLSMIAGVVLFASMLLDLVNFLPEFHKGIVFLKWFSMLFLAACFVGMELKKKQLRKNWDRKD